MSLDLTKKEARKATDARLAEVKNSTRSDSAPHQHATDEIAYRHRKRMLWLTFWFSIATVLVSGVIWIGFRIVA